MPRWRPRFTRSGFKHAVQTAHVAQAQLEEANVQDARAPGGDDAVDERNPVNGGDEIVDMAGGGGDDTNME